MSRLIRIFPALDPFGKSGVETWDIGLEQGQLDCLLQENGDVRDKVQLSRLVLAQEVAQNPIVVLQDLKRHETEESLCYCGRPSHDFRGLQIETPPPPGMVFCVYVTKTGKMTRWKWEKSDQNDPDLPENSNHNRFGRIVWPSLRAI